MILFAYPASQNNGRTVNSFARLLLQFFTAISVRLQGPSSANGTGRVEIFYNGQWGTICDDHIGI